MLRKFRIIFALFTITAVTQVLLDIGGGVARWLGWLPKIQFMPALLSLNILVIAVLLLSAWLVGRLYCSVVCPLGILQDVFSRLHIMVSGKTKRRIGRFHFRKANTALRIAVLACFAVLVFLAALNVVALSLGSFIEPYAAYSRIVGGLGVPLADALNNWLADMSAAHDSYIFVTVYRHTSTAITIVGAVTLMCIFLCSWLDGRWYCNNICPVGTGLGLISSHALLRPAIDTGKCNGCRSCERHCKASCIDSKNHKIDLSRCVMCMDCVDACRQHAISISARRPQKAEAPKMAATDKTRRAFMLTGGLAVGALATLAAGKEEGDGGLTPVWSKKSPVRKNRVIPAGAISYANMDSKCVACQLCINNCPSGVLKPSASPERFMQPVMDFTDGYCTPECTVCADICPAGAISPITEVLKSSTKVGTAVVDTDRCISAVYGTDCGNCERHCPAQAITLYWATEDEDDRRSIPVVNENLCIGCGACEYHCPVGSVEITDGDHAAIHVEGISRHRKI